MAGLGGMRVMRVSKLGWGWWEGSCALLWRGRRRSGTKVRVWLLFRSEEYLCGR